VEKCPTETYTPLGMAKLGAEPEPLIKAVFRKRIRIHRIHVFFGLPDPYPLIRGMDPDPALDPDPSILISSCKNNKKNLESYYLVTLFDFLSLKNNVNVPSKSNKQKKLCKKLVFCWHLEGQ
jgi:hypothetical protein